MRDKEFLLDLESGVRMRCWHRTERGQVTAFTVQMELLVGGHWEPVVRFDTAHGFAHRDLYCAVRNFGGRSHKTAQSAGRV